MSLLGLVIRLCAFHRRRFNVAHLPGAVAPDWHRTLLAVAARPSVDWPQKHGSLRRIAAPSQRELSGGPRRSTASEMLFLHGKEVDRPACFFIANSWRLPEKSGGPNVVIIFSI